MNLSEKIRHTLRRPEAPRDVLRQAEKAYVDAARDSDLFQEVVMGTRPPTNTRTAEVFALNVLRDSVNISRLADGTLTNASLGLQHAATGRRLRFSEGYLLKHEIEDALREARGEDARYSRHRFGGLRLPRRRKLR